MKDALYDIVQHTVDVGTLTLIKITGDDKTTQINSVAEDRSVILDAQFHSAIPEFVGVFGMPNLNKLKTILNITEYQENAQLTITHQQDADGNRLPSGIDFENKAGDFRNNYRFVLANIVNDQLKSVKFRGVNWDVEVSPSVVSIQRMRFQSQANSDETSFVATMNKDKLEFHFGNKSTHAGQFVFAQAVSGKLTAGRLWPVQLFNSILSLPGEKMLRFSDQGAAQISVDSGLAMYNYTIPALQK